MILHADPDMVFALNLSGTRVHFFQQEVRDEWGKDKCENGRKRPIRASGEFGRISVLVAHCLPQISSSVIGCVFSVVFVLFVSGFVLLSA